MKMAHSRFPGRVQPICCRDRTDPTDPTDRAELDRLPGARSRNLGSSSEVLSPEEEDPMMSIRHLPLVVVLLTAAAAPAFAVRSTAPGRSGEDYYLRNPSAASSAPVDRDQDGVPVEF